MVGVAAHDFIKNVLFESPIIICLMLIIGGVILLAIDRMTLKPKYHDIMDYPLSLCFKIGLFQVLALIPGTSRSGATIAGSLLGSVAQRLLRCVCDNCKRGVPANEKLLDVLDPDQTVSRSAKFYRGEGCKKCLGTGFSGRIPIFEIMPITPDITMAIEAGASRGRNGDTGIA